MSATGRGKKRAANDFYRTPAWAVRRILEARTWPMGAWAEPCCGDGAIVRAVCDYYGPGVEIHASDKQRGVLAGAGCADATHQYEPPFCNMSVCITNPPYSQSLEIAQHLVGLGKFEHVLLLLPLSFLASKRRHHWLRSHMPDVFVLPNRPSFTGKGTDACDYCWCHWQDHGNAGSVGFIRGESSLCILNLTDKSEMASCRV